MGVDSTPLFVILQKYDFSSKSQRYIKFHILTICCLWYCKSTIFQANHNWRSWWPSVLLAVCDTAKVRFFKQITTCLNVAAEKQSLFVILQKYDFSSKSQLHPSAVLLLKAVCDTAKVRFFKQITTLYTFIMFVFLLFVILQKYDFSSKSQLKVVMAKCITCCLWYCKSTIFQANHNARVIGLPVLSAVCDTAKVRFFKQITTHQNVDAQKHELFVILQKYDFSSKSQRVILRSVAISCCLWYCKSTIFQANHNEFH